jgi:hypothetical protein
MKVYLFLIMVLVAVPGALGLFEGPYKYNGIHLNDTFADLGFWINGNNHWQTVNTSAYKPNSTTVSDNLTTTNFTWNYNYTTFAFAMNGSANRSINLQLEDATSAKFQIRIKLDGTGNFTGFVYSYAEGYIISSSDLGVAEDSSWHNLTFARNSTYDWIVWMDDRDRTLSGNSADTSTYNKVIFTGSSDAQYSDYFIDDFMIYDLIYAPPYPNTTINQPTGTLAYNTNIPLQYTVQDGNASHTCRYRVTDLNGVEQVAWTTLANCDNTTYSLNGEGTFYTYVWTGDYIGRSNTTNQSFTIDLPEQGGGSGGAGGGTRLSSDKEAIIDFGVPFLGITILTVPSKKNVELIVKNVGDNAVRGGKIKFTGAIEKYIDAEFCDLDQVCEQNVDLEAGESALLNLTIETDNSLGAGVEGILTIQTGDGDFELPIVIDRPPFYTYYSSIAAHTGWNEVFSMLIVYLVAISLVFGMFKFGLEAGA